MPEQVSRVEEGRRIRRGRVVAAAIGTIGTAWGVFKLIVEIANLPSDTNEAWEALVTASSAYPILLVALAAAALIWSFWPRSMASPEPVSTSDDEQLYRDELARQRAIRRAAEQAEQEAVNRQFVRSLGFGNIGSVFEEAEKDRRAAAEAQRQRMIREAGEAPTRVATKFDMPLHEVFRHVAFESKWALAYDRLTDADPECRKDAEYALAKEIREALSCGEVVARGRHYVQGTDWGFTLASEPIPQSFWPNTYMQPFGEIALTDDARGIVTLVRRTNADPTDKYREVKLRRDEVLTHWPRQKQIMGPLAPTQFAKDYVRELQRQSRRLDDEPEC